ncbi:Lipoprotein-releasing system ATP-binding protein LolD [Corynebacterium glaucum]|uniref:Lipoprotein-releasing system ATP-binding protein LolD n=2 Tax=Corynebacterium glaucum TaxID=187491 RepID=A0A1Q2HXN3_9CORY|nr:Lipoprotein-releasing system ATP-binding protein LolD [Corynebacterium glaucum]
MSTPFWRKKSRQKAEPQVQSVPQPQPQPQHDNDPFFFGEEPATGEQPAVAPEQLAVAPEQPAAPAAPAGPQLADTGLLIDMRNIVKTYNVGEPSELTVLHGVEFQAQQREFVSIVGPSGGGKSTLMNLIGMLDRPTEGAYAFNGEPVYAKSDKELATYRSHNIGFVFQNFNLVGRIDALQNVAMPMMYAGVDKKAREARAEELLGMMGMGERIHHQPNELSGGQKQRVAIARALANDPDLLLADEPTGALDTKTGRLVMDLFHQLHDELGKAIVLITHNPELAEETERIVEIIDGRINDIREPSGMRHEGA